MGFCTETCNLNFLTESKCNMEKFSEKNPCVKFGRLDTDGKIVCIKKNAYDTDKESIEAARMLDANQHTIYKVITCKCPNCFKWHIGGNGKPLSGKDKKTLYCTSYMN